MAKVKLTKHTFYFRKGDVASLLEFCSGKNHTASDIIRALVSRYVDEIVNSPTELPDESPQDLNVQL